MKPILDACCGGKMFYFDKNDPRVLKKIMGFPEDYVLVGTQADQKKFIGNAVEVTIARAWCEALCR